MLLTPQRAAVALGMGWWKLSDLLRPGRLRSTRIGSCRRISTAALLEFVTELVRTRVSIENWIEPPEEPLLRGVPSGAEVACHFPEEVPS